MGTIGTPAARIGATSSSNRLQCRSDEPSNTTSPSNTTNSGFSSAMRRTSSARSARLSSLQNSRREVSCRSPIAAKRLAVMEVLLRSWHGRRGQPANHLSAALGHAPEQAGTVGLDPGHAELDEREHLALVVDDEAHDALERHARTPRVV